MSVYVSTGSKTLVLHTPTKLGVTHQINVLTLLCTGSIVPDLRVVPLIFESISYKVRRRKKTVGPTRNMW